MDEFHLTKSLTGDSEGEAGGVALSTAGEPECDETDKEADAVATQRAHEDVAIEVGRVCSVTGPAEERSYYAFTVTVSEGDEARAEPVAAYEDEAFLTGAEPWAGTPPDSASPLPPTFVASTWMGPFKRHFAPEGPWHDEPDRVEWDDPATALPCLLLRNTFFGSLCGYVGVAPGHVLHGRQPPGLLSAHGGVNFVTENDDDLPRLSMQQAYTHRHQLGGRRDTTGYWWFGFDANHGYDATPARLLLGGMTSGLEGAGPSRRPIYRTVWYMMEECAGLARQIDEIGRVGVKQARKNEGMRRATALQEALNGEALVALPPRL